MLQRAELGSRNDGIGEPLMKDRRRTLTFAISLTLLFVLSTSPAFGAAVETPGGKRIPGKIVEEQEGAYKVGTDLPGGGRIIFSVDKEKVDPHGTVPGKGRIEDLRGNVQIKKKGMPRFIAASKHMAVGPGDQIRTAEDSEAVITLETTALNGVKENTHFTVNRFEVNPETNSAEIKVELPQGRLWSEVGKLKTKDSKFEVETPSAVTGVRGTVFLVEVERETAETSVSVLAGEVAVGSKEVEVPEVVLRKREALLVRRGEEPRKLSPTELVRHIAMIVEEWVRQSDYFQTASALAGIGQLEELDIEPGLPEAEKQKVYDAIQAGWEKASEDFFELDKALKLFYLDFGRFPSVEEGGLDALVHSTGLPQWNGPYTEAEFLKDHYGMPYGYAVLRDIHGNTYVKITTYGYDRKPDTQDDRQKILTEEDARRWEDKKSYR